MRPLYLFLKFLLKITLWIYYPRFLLVNRPEKRLGRTIYMSNHASSFMDPLVVAGMQKPIVFFMTRADIYNGIMKVIFWLAHMLPIYRQQDKGDTKKKNEAVFRTCYRVLKYGRNLLVFSEGFTDDIFIRRLKPLKKGAVRIGFSALDNCNWKHKIHIQAVGLNYSDPDVLGSDCLISNGDPVCLNSYEKEYKTDPHKTILRVTQRMEKEMRSQITDVRNIKMASFHENIMRLTRKGMHPIDSDKSIPLIDRWKYSRALANWMNASKIEEDEKLMNLKQRIEDYFKQLEQLNVEETPLYKITSKTRKKGMDIFYLIALFPFMVLGYAFTYLPYKLIKNFVEKSVKRRVFWSSIKMLVGFAAVGGYSLILLLIIAKITGLSFLFLLFLGVFIVPILFVIARNWSKTLVLHQKMEQLTSMDLSSIVDERELLLQMIRKEVPVS